MRSLIGQDALRIGAIYPKARLGLRHPINQHFQVLILNICLDSDFADHRKEDSMENTHNISNWQALGLKCF